MEKKKKILIGKVKENKGQKIEKNAPSAALPSAALVLLGEDHSGRDEMNLAGHPFALLQAPGRTSENEIISELPRVLPDGRLVTAKWHVSTPEAYGLPGPNEELLYLVLLQLTREAADGGEWPAKVNFSRLDVLSRLGWAPNSGNYVALTLAFNRLSAVHINAQHAFWDARHKTLYASIGFGILSSYAIADEPRGRKGQGHLPHSWFQWDEVLHTSFHAGNVRSLALDFAISLEHPTTRRLFRLLELLRHAGKPPRPQIQMELEKLRSRLGMASYRFPSKIKEKLGSAHDELLKRGYLAEVAYEKNREGELMAVYTFAKVNPAQVVPQGLKGPQIASDRPETASVREMRTVCALPSLDFGRSLPDASDTDAENAALDAAFEALPEDRRSAIDAIATSELPPFLRERVALPGGRRLPGVQMELQRVRRREVARELSEQKTPD